MRGILFILSLAAGITIGCANRPSLGWRFECGRPSTQSVPIMLHQTSGQLSVAPIGSGPGLAPDVQYQTQPLTTEYHPRFIRKRNRVEILPPVNGNSVSDPCDWDEMCRRLGVLEMSYAKPPANSAFLPMPRAKE